MFFSSVNYSFIEAGNKQPSTINFHQRGPSKALHHHGQGHAWKAGDFRHGGCRHHRVGEPRGDQVSGGTEGGLEWGWGWLDGLTIDPKMTNSCWFMIFMAISRNFNLCILKSWLPSLQLIYNIFVYTYMYTPCHEFGIGKPVIRLSRSRLAG